MPTPVPPSTAAPSVNTPANAPVGFSAVPSVELNGIAYGVSIVNNTTKGIGFFAIHVTLPAGTQLVSANPMADYDGSVVSWYQRVGPEGRTTMSGYQMVLSGTPQ